ncbi:tetratricopeptide repeat protein [Microcoleus sp. bin38.metabat.b11b12b14.051]|uniref:tetratricopeptide repeat protein n=1 Tax=Microcoleus sp. bin38.metabat.b11b12b14.051 TaxID=2742709 RepID=UPI0025F65341|nr:tetratricopeptide repeat protein [Microcoleus sp. bin38.metabat.b11b12b14.051]
MLSNKPLNQSKKIPEIYQQRIVELNQQSFDELLTFVDIVPDDAFDLGFIQSNFAKDRDAIIQALINHPDCQDMQFEIWDFPDPDMRFLMDEILKVLPTVKVQPDKKLIFIVRGVENAIGMTGEYPPMLVDFNWVRDAYPVKVPHLMLFCLPDYAITRVANFAPDFWAWNSGTFVFKTPANTRDDAISQTLDASKGISYCELPEKQERIDLLKRLLIEYTPSNGREETHEDLKTRIRVLNDLGIAYRTRSEYKTATYYLKQALDLAKDDEDFISLKANTLYELGWIENDSGNKQEAIALYQQSLELKEKIGDVQGKAASLHQLAGIYANRGDVDEAIALYQQSLELKEKIGDVQGKAASLHQLAGIYANRGDVEEAIALYQQSLELKEKIGDVGGKAASLHQLAGIYANRGDVEEAIALYQQSLELKEKIGDVGGKAASLHQLAGIYANRGDVEEAIALYQQSLELKEKIGDVGGKAASLHCLAGIYAHRGDVEEAIELYQQSLELKEKIGNVQGKAASFAMLGQLLASQGNFEQALNYLQQSLEILQHLDSPDAETVKEIIARVQQMADG